MEKVISEKNRLSDNSVDIGNSSEDFQKFLYELFEKNGVLTDLRAYLRGQIINVLKSVNTGDPLMCQKHFVQRLECTYQALNILIVEYLLRMEFNYSLSVFMSEIPLANMKFDLAKSLLGSTIDGYKDLKFKDNDVWCILNFLGVKCDSEMASSIVEMYRKKNNYPLLLCLLQNFPLHLGQSENFESGNTSESSVTSSSWVSSISLTKCNKKSEPFSTCHHFSYCGSCKHRMSRFRRKYKKKKLIMYKDAKESSLEGIKIETLLKNVDVMERSIIEEMFEQLKSVYETELEMVKEEEKKKIKRSLANHTLLFQKRYDEMEESFRAREAELDSNIRQKKKFLWGLARALRRQHSNMSTAMSAVQMESERLNNKEDILVKQIKEAEQMLKQSGESMRNQISTEVIVLESRLNAMRSERDIIERERSEIERLRELCESNTRMSTDTVKERDELNGRYNTLMEEFSLLKKQLALAKIGTKCYVERAVMTDRRTEFNATMNNVQELERERNIKSEEAMKTPNQVVNDLKKQKNVNFDQTHFEENSLERSRGRCRAGAGSDASGAHDRHLETVLRDENERLKAFADQQREHIDELTREHMRLRSELVTARMASPRPRTAPTLPTSSPLGVNPSGARTATGLRRGAGEEMSVFTPRPADGASFVDTRRHLIKQWRSLKSRFVPVSGSMKSAAGRAGSSRREDPVQTNLSPPKSSPISCSANQVLPDSPCIADDCDRPPLSGPTTEENKKREKSPKSFLREAKLKLKSKDSIKQQPSVTSREKSPNSMLREAKLRLRKLEIEAEAVEKSYLDFRRRRSEMRNEELPLTSDAVPKLEDKGKNFYILPTNTSLNNKYNDELKDHNINMQDIEYFNKDFDKYLREYREFHETKINNKTPTAFKINTSPVSSLNVNENLEGVVRNVDYVETPLKEFRKLYHNPKPRSTADNSLSKPTALNSYEAKQKIVEEQVHVPTNDFVKADEKPKDDTETSRLASAAINKIKELKILKDRLSEIYGKPNGDDVPSQEPDVRAECTVENVDDKMNLLKIEVVSETTNVKVDDSRENLMIVVESSIDSKLQLSQENINSYVPTIVISPKTDLVDLDGEKTFDSDANSIVSVSSISRSALPDDESQYKSNAPPEEAAHLTRNDVLDAIFDAQAAKDLSSVDMDLGNSKEGLDSMGTEGEGDHVDYADDFLADVDNYNSRSEENSPVSLAKTSEEDNFWD